MNGADTANCCFCLKIIGSKNTGLQGSTLCSHCMTTANSQHVAYYREGGTCKYTKPHSYIIYYYRVLLSERDAEKIFEYLPSLIIPTMFAYCLHTFWHAIHISFYILNVFLLLHIYIYIYIHIYIMDSLQLFDASS